MNELKNVNQNADISVGLDIGTSKLCLIIAQKDKNSNDNKILGLGITDSEGLSRGVITNIDKTVNAIKKIVQQAEQQSGIKIEDVVVGIAGDHIESLPQRGIISISNRNKEITKDDVDRLIRETKNISIPADRQIIHVFPQSYIIDGQDGVTDPIGMSGIRMEAEVLIITASSTAIQNIYRCVERAGLRVKDLVLEPIAASNATLNDEEKEVGVALVDIGGGTTDIAIYYENVLRHISIFSIAGKHITDDIRKVLGIIGTQAELIKRKHGNSLTETISEDEIFMVPGVAGRSPKEISKKMLSQIIQARSEEILEFINAELKNSNLSDSLGAGIVLTGGCSLLDGLDELAEKLLNQAVKIGIPSGFSSSGLAPETASPLYSTAVGLTLWGFNQYNNQDESKTSAKLVFIDDEFKETDKIKIGDKSSESDDIKSDSKESLLGRIKNIMTNL